MNWMYNICLIVYFLPPYGLLAVASCFIAEITEVDGCFFSTTCGCLNWSLLDQNDFFKQKEKTVNENLFIEILIQCSNGYSSLSKGRLYYRIL